MSTNSVSAPAWLMASTVAMNVCATVTTASPGPTPAAISANRTASVPLATPTQYFVPQKAANSRSNASTCGAANEAGAAHGLAEGVDELLFELAMGGDQIEERNRRVGHGCGRVTVVVGVRQYAPLPVNMARGVASRIRRSIRSERLRA